MFKTYCLFDCLPGSYDSASPKSFAMPHPLIQSLQAHGEEFVALRRDLHRHPELGLREVRTSQRIADCLERWGCEAHRGGTLHLIFQPAEEHPGGAKLMIEQGLQHCTGSYLLIANGDGPGGCMVHNPGYEFNDDNVALGAAQWALLVERFLSDSTQPLKDIRDEQALPA